MGTCFNIDRISSTSNSNLIQLARSNNTSDYGCVGANQG